jgi:hypothetical protein
LTQGNAENASAFPRTPHLIEVLVIATDRNRDRRNDPPLGLGTSGGAFWSCKVLRQQGPAACPDSTPDG